MLKELLGRCGAEGNDDGVEGDCVDEVEYDGTDDIKRDSKDGDRDLRDNGEDDDIIESGGEESGDDHRKCTVVIYSLGPRLKVSLRLEHLQSFFSSSEAMKLASALEAE